MTAQSIALYVSGYVLVSFIVCVLVGKHIARRDRTARDFNALMGGGS